MTRVLIAIDESEESIGAARAAHDLFGDDAWYLAVNVADRVVPWVDAGLGFGATYQFADGWQTMVPLDDRANAAERDEARATAAAAAHSAGVDAQPVGKVGDPALAVLEAAENAQADVIVVGAHARRWWEKLLPSVAATVVKDATVPVLVVNGTS